MMFHDIKKLNIFLIIISFFVTGIVISLYPFYQKFRTGFTLLITLLFSLMFTSQFFYLLRYTWILLGMEFSFTLCFLSKYFGQIFNLCYVLIFSCILGFQLCLKNKPHFKKRLLTKKVSVSIFSLAVLLSSFLWALPLFFDATLFALWRKGNCVNLYMANKKLALYRGLLFLMLCAVYSTLVVQTKRVNKRRSVTPKRSTTVSKSGAWRCKRDIKRISFQEKINIIYYLSIPLFFSHFSFIVVYMCVYNGTHLPKELLSVLETLYFISCACIGFIILLCHSSYKNVLAKIAKNVCKYPK